MTLAFNAVNHRVDRLERPRQILREARIVRLVDLKLGGTGAHELLQLEVQHASEIERKRLFRLVELVLDALDQRVRARDRDLDLCSRESAEEARLFCQPQRSSRQLRAHDAVVEVVVEPLRPEIDLHPGHALGEVVDHVVALRLAVRDDVDAGDFLILDGGFSHRIVHLVEIPAAQTAREVLVLRAFEPLGHRIAADNRGRKDGQWRRHGVSVSIIRVNSQLPRTNSQGI